MDRCIFFFCFAHGIGLIGGSKILKSTSIRKKELIFLYEIALGFQQKYNIGERLRDGKVLIIGYGFIDKKFYCSLHLVLDCNNTIE